MPFGKRATGPGLQITLELASRSFITKFELDHESPWSICRRVPHGAVLCHLRRPFMLAVIPT